MFTNISLTTSGANTNPATTIAINIKLINLVPSLLNKKNTATQTKTAKNNGVTLVCTNS